MNKIKKVSLIASAFVLSLFNIGVYAADNFQYMQLESVLSQPANAATNTIAFDKVDGALKMGLAKQNVTVGADGVYFIMATAQIGALKSDAKLNGYVDLWLNQNGVPIPGTNSRITIIDNSTGPLITQFIAKVKAGDKISVGFSASNPGLGLVAIPASNGEEAIPSASFSIYTLN